MGLIFTADAIGILTVLKIREIPDSLIFTFMIMAAVKWRIYERLELYRNKIAAFVVASVTLMLNSGIILKQIGLDEETFSKEIKLIYIAAAATAAFGAACMILRNVKVRYDVPLMILSVLIVVLCIISIPQFKLIKGDDGGIKGGYFQVPEMLKLLIVLLAVKTAGTNAGSLRHYIGISAFAAIVTAFVIGEKGTAVLLAYFIPLSSMLIAYKMIYDGSASVPEALKNTCEIIINVFNNRKKKNNKSAAIVKSVTFWETLKNMLKKLINKIKGIDCSEKENAEKVFAGSVIALAFILGLMKAAERVLYFIFPFRGEKGYYYLNANPDFRDSEFMAKLYEWSLRLSADGEQIVFARDILRSSPSVRVNYLDFADIIYSDSKTALSDFVFTEFANSFGWLSAAIVIGSFIISLVIVAVKCDIKAKIPAVCLAIQALMQVSGILGYVFTGINIPFLSCGGSSAFTSFIFLAVILMSLVQPETEESEKKEVCHE